MEVRIPRRFNQGEEMNRNEAYEAMVRGEKVTNKAYLMGEKNYCHMVDGVFMFHRNGQGDEQIVYSMSPKDSYSIFEEPKKMVRWYRITYLRKFSCRPYTFPTLYRSVEEFLLGNSLNEENYHWFEFEFAFEKEEI